ncbi:MAG: hypothetical protein R2770_09440 [Acidimicrobiales bacterium]
MSSGSLELSLQRASRRLSHRPHSTAPLLAVVAAVVGVLVGIATRSGPSSLPLVTGAGVAAQVLLFVVMRRVVGRSLALGVAVCGAWLVYFTLRIAVTQIDRSNRVENELVRAAGDSTFVWAWLITTAGLAAVVAGAALAGAGRPSGKYVPDLGVATLEWFAVVGVVGRAAMVFGGVASGFVENVLSLYLLAFAALGYRSVAEPALRRRLYLLVGAASTLGVLTSFKEAAIVPIAALTVGMLAAGARLERRRIVALAFVGLTVFVGVQGNRIAWDAGEPVPLWKGAIVPFTTYDYESGHVADPNRDLVDAAVSVGKGMSRRFGGATSLILVRERVPTDVDHLGGKSLWQPAVSAMPVVAGWYDLEFSTLSLGRYFTTTFVAPDQPENSSSQAITMPADLYLNFGDTGVVLGLLVFGFVVGRVDRLFHPGSATRVGALVYLGHVLVGIERNVAYVGVNAAIRLVVLLLVLRGVARWGALQGSARRTLAG